MLSLSFNNYEHFAILALFIYPSLNSKLFYRVDYLKANLKHHVISPTNISVCIINDKVLLKHITNTPLPHPTELTGIFL